MAGVWTGLCGVEVFCGVKTGSDDESPRPVPTLAEQKDVLTLCKDLNTSRPLTYNEMCKKTALTEVSLFFAELGGVTRTFAGTFCP